MNCLGVLFLSGCQWLSYYHQAAIGQLDIRWSQMPIEDVMADPNTSTALKRKLALTQEARTFAIKHLQLPDNQSYTDYVDLKRPYAVWNLIATPEFSLTPIEHCFPIAGCVSYLGFFSKTDAESRKEQWVNRGDDTYLFGVSAYSTLGWFKDPITNVMVSWTNDPLVGTIFHEMAHQKIYLPGDTTFNESFARFVELQGLKAWHEKRGSVAEDRWRAHKRHQLLTLIVKTRDQLQQLYQNRLSSQSAQEKAVAQQSSVLTSHEQIKYNRIDEQVRQNKRAIFDGMQVNYEVLKQSWRGDRYFDRVMAGPWSNARLVPYDLYERWVPAFNALFQDANGDWLTFYSKVKTLAQMDESKRWQVLKSCSPKP